LAFREKKLQKRQNLKGVIFMSSKTRPSFGVSVGLFLSIVGILIVGIFYLQVGIHVLLVIGATLTALVSKRLGYTWEEIQSAMGAGVGRGMVAMFIFILIGMVIGSWIHCGAVPAAIYYGLDLLTPITFLPLGLVICSITSLTTGTSWGTAGTIGLAMMGIGSGLGVPAPVTAGMVISGACLGDKMSPLSDTTNLAAVSADTDLYAHIRAMMYTTIPSFLIALVAFSIIGMKYSGGTLDVESIASIQGALSAEFNITPLALLPMILVIALSIMKVPAVPAMISGVFLGSLLSLLLQDASLAEALTAINYGFSGESSVAAVNDLLNRGGIQSMMWTFSLSFIALSLGGALDEMGYLSVIVEGILSKVRSAAGLMTAAVLTAIAGNAAMGEAYLSIILNGRLYHKAFEKVGLRRSMLSRATEEGATLTTTIIPWTTAGAFMAATLGVPTIYYLPFALLNWINPLLSIILSYLGIFMFYRKEADERT
jgi:NhaC family Na+:H+ antiporter